MIDFIENELGQPTCPECGEIADWHECEECKGLGLIGCKCEGCGGWYECPICEASPFLEYLPE